MTKKEKDRAVLAFVTRCIKCEKYDSGRCERYNREMDDSMLGKIPVCDECKPGEEA